MKLNGAGEEEIEIKFKTSDERFSVPDDPIRVNVGCDIENLNSLINSLLSEYKPEHQTTTFQFFLNGEPIRKSIFVMLELHDLSKEGTFTVEYEPSLPEPDLQSSIPHKDWISSVKGFSQNRIAVGCYDNTVSLCSVHGKIAVGTGHTKAVTCVDWLSSDRFVSGSDDCTLMIWSVGDSKLLLDSVMRNPDEITSVAVSPDKNKILCGSKDKSLRVWIPDQEVARKSPTTTVSSPLLMVEDAHNGIVTDVQWISDNEAVSCSWDHHVNVWDMNSATQIQSIVLPHRAIWSLSYSPISQLVVTAAADNIIRLYDLRSSEGTIIKTKFCEHKLWVYDVCWFISSPNYFASAGKDGFVKVWDIRNNKSSVCNVARHDKKALAVDCSIADFVISGGDDSILNVASFHAN